MKKMTEEALRSALKLYFIMGSPNCEKSSAEVLKEAIAGGVSFFQFREKGNGALKGDQKYALAEELQYICKQGHVPFIVNDDIDLALALNADGVHIGQDDEEIKAVREKIGDKILGVSVHNIVEAKAAVEAGADYFGVGPIFPTKTKEDANPVQGLNIIEILRSEGFTIPLVGIGGIHAENAGSVIEAGADGISLISAISLADDVQEAARELSRKVTAKGGVRLE
ncbi:thiamine phosphate synthase [Bacillus dakarensis]|uniref:thiamine phosphate synthase n=1 Tax=Robertmurraya dakarensis TaxID=1926278 RepID=UPI00098158E9|nr:thiamine phosphate synthase [Bacillus dakarensis]